MKIEKKTWKEYFNRIKKGEKNIEVRLADFKLKKGDIIIFKEFDPKTKKYTGRIIKKRAKNVIKFDIAKAYSLKKIKKYGVYEIELK